MMEKVKKFEIEVPVAFDGEEYDGVEYSLQVEDKNTELADAYEGCGIAEIEIQGNSSHVSFVLNLEAVEALFDIFEHIRGKVLAQKKEEK